jgi:hypothetical protein
MNIHYIKDGIVRIKRENIKLINGEALSSTLVEDLASYDNKRQDKIKGNHYKMKAYKEMTFERQKNDKQRSFCSQIHLPNVGFIKDKCAIYNKNKTSVLCSHASISVLDCT